MSGSDTVTVTTDASGSVSVLNISSVQTSHAGMYICAVSVRGGSQTESSDVLVQCKYNLYCRRDAKIMYSKCHTCRRTENMVRNDNHN